MKIAILTPHPVPLALGGLENFAWGLQSAIARLTPHRCDVVGLVSPEAGFWEVIESYRTAFSLDLSGYDCVISGKYPCWMVDHPHHVVMMLHKLRGLYDTYPGDADAGAGLAAHAALAPVLAFMAERSRAGRPDGRAENGAVLDMLSGLRGADLPPELFALPGAFARQVVHFLDAGALGLHQIAHFATLSRTVAGRADYFPPGVMPEVLYPPPHRDDYRCGAFDYLFTTSRLDGPKRLDVLIAAMARVKAPITLKIAGTGPEAERLKALAGDDPRIAFLGFVPDDAMPALYADALAVPFIPYDEDYGLVTIEAMRSGKPVLTFTDSGGPCEFVVDGETGFVTPPRPAALAARIDWLHANPEAARTMGAAAREAVAPITWEALVSGLLPGGAAAPVPAAARRPRLTVATSFPVFPPMGGGQARVHHLYAAMARSHDIEIVSFSDPQAPGLRAEIAPGLVETRIPRSRAHQEAEWAYADRLGNLPVSDVAMADLAHLTPDYRTALTIAARSSDAVIACHPYLLAEIEAAAPALPLWYEAQDVEADVKADVFAAAPLAAQALDRVREVEARCWRRASVVFACAQRDLDRLDALYGPTRARRLEVPNGVALGETPFTGPPARAALKAALGLGELTSALFMGSWHGPNLAAIEQILAEAPEHPDTAFWVMGSAGDAFAGRPLPANVRLLGQVDGATRRVLLASADVALNPMCAGSGTNLKMLDYFAAGIPVISSAFGARGLAVAHRTHLLVTDGPAFGPALRTLRLMSERSRAAMIDAARALTEDRYDWTVIADRFIADLKAR